MSDNKVLLAVNGTLMRGLELNPNMLAVGAEFVAESATTADYRCWSIGDCHPGMVCFPGEGAEIALELWAVPPAGLGSILQKEPAGLSIGKVTLKDGQEVLGVLAEPWLVEGQREITETGGWRNYTGHHHID
ncbi:glutamyl-tRNA amidotransferase [Aeromonas enteropelogenes]|uniref:allophanate hydrolase-related protein n=1 Tax=Aeromonas enteropelogenes TaxID=29489 RepID=UPI00191E9CC4|nr:gamma-glutamylcyclotransferase [Aeromonas enteropelogenes]MBL0520690.1 glutamyl-tRNA amidotransferase [Aeromonas enteropelogenes]